MQASQGSDYHRNARSEGHIQSNLPHLVSVLIQGHESEYEKAIFELEATISGMLIHHCDPDLNDLHVL